VRRNVTAGFWSALLTFGILGGAGCHPTSLTTDAGVAQRPADGGGGTPAIDGSGAVDTKASADGVAGAGGDAALHADAAECLGTCLDTLYAGCPKTMLTCVQSKTATSIASCYSNGVKQNLVQDGTTTIVTVNKANGDLCYTITIPSTMSQSIADATGAKVVDIRFFEPPTSFVITCAQTGVMTSVDLTTPQCAAHAFSAQPACTPGSCVWP
jgi:hypothetical protein